MSIARTSELTQKIERGGATAIARALAGVEKRLKRESIACLSQHAAQETFVHSRGHAEDMLLRLHSMINTLDFDMDDLVEEIVRGTVAEGPPAVRA